jgi:hypothetical protein
VKELESKVSGSESEVVVETPEPVDPVKEQNQPTDRRTKLIDKYVEIKEIEDGQPLIMKLILDHFLPNNRFEEARSWRNALEDKGLKSEADKAINER